MVFSNLPKVPHGRRKWFGFWEMIWTTLALSIYNNCAHPCSNLPLFYTRIIMNGLRSYYNSIQRKYDIYPKYIINFNFSNAVGNSVQLVNSMPSPRFIKSHLPWQLLPQQLDIVKPKV